MNSHELTRLRGHGICRLQAVLQISVFAALCLAVSSCEPQDGAVVDSINILAFGIFEFDRTTADKDPTSSVGARLVRGQKFRISQHTDRIPLRQGLSSSNNLSLQPCSALKLLGGRDADRNAFKESVEETIGTDREQLTWFYANLEAPALDGKAFPAAERLTRSGRSTAGCRSIS